MKPTASRVIANWATRLVRPFSSTCTLIGTFIASDNGPRRTAGWLAASFAPNGSFIESPSLWRLSYALIEARRACYCSVQGDISSLLSYERRMSGMDGDPNLPHRSDRRG